MCWLVRPLVGLPGFASSGVKVEDSKWERYCSLCSLSFDFDSWGEGLNLENKLCLKLELCESWSS